ncbi:MAG: tRNA adenosine(34) deaminase TadA [Myxococcota bacterium]|nr:tRNA adenosine(34) deaminase TadA [Myxococcota bacterium]
MLQEKIDIQWMRECLNLARDAAVRGEVPVGAIVVHDGVIIGRGYNLREATADPTAHAEVIALREASQHLGFWRILDATLYVTLEPCAMCAGALVNARVSRLVYGCKDPKSGAIDSVFKIVTDTRLNHRLTVTSGVLERECAEILSEFFREKRRQKAELKAKTRRGGRVDEGA